MLSPRESVVIVPRPLYRLLQITVRWTCLIFLQSRCFGAWRVPRRGGLVIVANHQSYLDPPVIGCHIPRVLWYMARDSLFRHRALAGAIRFFRAIPVRREEADAASFRRCVKLLQRGHCVLMFPEGRRSLDGRVGRCRGGAVALAARAEVPMLPVVIEGAHEAWGRDVRWPKPRPIWILIGDPIDPAALADRSSAESGDRLARILRKMHNQLRARAGRAPFDYPDGCRDEGKCDAASNGMSEGARHG